MPTESELASIGRGTVVIVDLEPAKGHEQKKVRPAVVVSSDTLNKALKTLIIVPISSVKPGVQPRSHEVFIRAGEGGLDVDSLAQPIQIRTIDRTWRVVKVLGQLSPVTMASISARLFAVLGGVP